MQHLLLRHLIRLQQLIVISITQHLLIFHNIY